MSCFSLNRNECLAITKCNTAINELVTGKQIEIIGGEILKVTRLSKSRDCYVQIYSCENRLLMVSTASYACNYAVLKIINKKFAGMLMSIPDRSKRLMISSSDETENFLTHLKLNDVVKVNHAIMNCDEDVVCIVKYIGAVPQIGPGTYIGMVLFNEMDSIDEKNRLARDYFNCNDRNGFIRNCGCFFTRNYLVDQNTTNLVAAVKKSIPPLKLRPVEQHQSTNPSAPYAATTSPTAVYPRQQFLAQTLPKPINPIVPRYVEEAREISSPINFASRYSSLNPNEKITIRRSIRNGTKRIVIEETVSQTCSSRTKKNNCLIM